MPILELHAKDITCEGCASAIQRALSRETGINSVEVDVDAQSVTVDYDADETDEQAIRDRLSRAGYDT